MYPMHTHTLQAYVQLARLERERAECEREREEKERKRKREQMRRVKRMLEAAFDGDTQEINAVLKEVKRGDRQELCHCFTHALTHSHNAYTHTLTHTLTLAHTHTPHTHTHHTHTHHTHTHHTHIQVATLYADESDLVVQRHRYKLVECTDPNNNTPLSEAGAGGDPDTLR